MWQTILNKVKTGLVAYWSQFVWFLVGLGLGVVLAGDVACAKAERGHRGPRHEEVTK